MPASLEILGGLARVEQVPFRWAGPEVPSR